MSNASAKPKLVHRFTFDSKEEKPDILAIEEPLEIRLGFGTESDRVQKSLSITMRTPGHDFELALGFLFTEGIIFKMTDVTHIDYCTDENGEKSENIVRVELSAKIKLDWEKFQRHFYTNSSCGICGKASIESLETICPTPISSALSVPVDVINSLGSTMKKEQLVFKHTGGLHAAGLFDVNGNILFMREDIGRHNALDKIIGAALFKGLVPLNQHIILLSGRSCFELIQKSVVASIPMVVSVGAPSSLAVETAERFNQTLVGFSNGARFNCYSGVQRIESNK
jgi:FdhD protein